MSSFGIHHRLYGQRWNRGPCFRRTGVSPLGQGEDVSFIHRPTAHQIAVLNADNRNGTGGLNPFRRWYFRANAPAEVSPAFDGAWTRTAEALRRHLAEVASASDAAAFGSLISFTSGQVVLMRQHVSGMLRGGIVITGANLSLVMRAVTQSSNGEDNTHGRVGARMFDASGTVLRATLLEVGAYGTDAEFPSPSASRILANDTLPAYTTMPGDRLVIETGFTDEAGTSPGASLYYGSDRADDYALEDGDETARNSWLELAPAA